MKNFNIIKLLSKEAESDKLLDLELKELIDTLKKKYALLLINVEATKNIRIAIKFLKKFDYISEKVAKDMEMPNEFIGLKGKIGLRYDNMGNDDFPDPFYCKNTKCINIFISSLDKSTLLHEWVHALDNYICNEFLNKNEYVSEQNKSCFQQKNYTELGYSYNTIKQLTEKITNKKNFYYLSSRISDNITARLIGIEKGYFTDPCEMLARYFESQVYNLRTNMSNLMHLLMFSLVYKIKKDKDFQKNKKSILMFLYNIN